MPSKALILLLEELIEYERERQCDLDRTKTVVQSEQRRRHFAAGKIEQ